RRKITLPAIATRLPVSAPASNPSCSARTLARVCVRSKPSAYGCIPRESSSARFSRRTLSCSGRSFEGGSFMTHQPMRSRLPVPARVPRICYGRCRGYRGVPLWKKEVETMGGIEVVDRGAREIVVFLTGDIDDETAEYMHAAVERVARLEELNALSH